MDTKIRKRYAPAIVKEIASGYGITPESLKELDGFESFIYEFEDRGKPFILRVAHSSRRSEALIRGEADWINYLVQGGVRAARVVRSPKGQLVEAVPDRFGGSFLATKFEKVPGKPAWEAGWTYQLYQTLGETIGRMHKLTMSYRPSDPLAARPDWDAPMILMGEDWLPPSESLVKEKYQQIVSWCQTLTKTREHYGLIHFDAHAGNFLVDRKGQIHLFDFDDCHYSWFSNDIAIVLFYLVMGATDRPAFTSNFMRQFIVGYQRENSFRAEWLEQIPNFLKMREIDLYGVLHRSYDVEHLEDDWDIRYMKGRKEKIEAEVPYIELDFRSLEAFL